MVYDAPGVPFENLIFQQGLLRWNNYILNFIRKRRFVIKKSLRGHFASLAKFYKAKLLKFIRFSAPISSIGCKGASRDLILFKEIL